MNLTLKDRRFYLSLPYDEELIIKAKSIPGYKWSKKTKEWSWAASRLSFGLLQEVFDITIPVIIKDNALGHPDPDDWEYKTFQPMKHQEEGIYFLLNQFYGMRNLTQGAALFMEMGTGKTKTVIDTAEMMYKADLIKRVLVVAPLPILGTWEDELKLHSSHSVSQPIQGNKDKRCSLIRVLQHEWGATNLVWGIINIEGLATVEEGLDVDAWDLIIVDESTVIKSRTAKRTKKLIKLFGHAPYKIIMSGNPIPKGPEEVFAQYSFIDPSIFGTSYTKFRDEYFTTDFFNGIEDWKNEEAKVKYYEKFHSIAFIARKQDCLDLPPKIYEVRKLTMSPEQAKIYKDMWKDAYAAIKIYNRTVKGIETPESKAIESITGDNATCAAPVVLTKLLRCSQITGGFLPVVEDGPDMKEGTVSFANNPKLKELVGIIEGLSEAEQVVVWARFHWEIELIEQNLKSAGISCVPFYGKTNYKERLEARKDFKEGKVKVFIGNPATGGKGLNDLIGATTVIYYSNDYSAENRQQSEDRNHRNGTVKVTYIDLVCEATIDEKVLTVLRENKDFSDEVLARNQTIL